MKLKFSECQKVKVIEDDDYKGAKGIIVETDDKDPKLQYKVYLSSSPANFVIWFGEDQLERAAMGSVSDGYHTFDELYDHRMVLTATTCALLVVANDHHSTYCSGSLNHYGRAYRSWQHGEGDSPMFDGMFIVMLELPNIGQVSYHYDAKHWPKFDMCETVDRAPKYDGHTPESTIERLYRWIQEEML